jgi:hypothetical protein
MNNQTMPSNHNVFVLETVRQLCHPVTGLKCFSPLPVSLGDWKKCLTSIYGWVNIGIEKNIADTFYELNIGEVCPSTEANMDIYTDGFATTEIRKLLNLSESEKNYKVILNYYSFSKLVGMLVNNTNEEYCLKMNTSLNTIFKDTNPLTFWLNVVISEQTARYLKLNDIGEIIVKEGSTHDTARLNSDFENKEKVLWKTEYIEIEDSESNTGGDNEGENEGDNEGDNEDDNEGDNEDDNEGDNEDKEYVDLKKNVSMNDEDNESENEDNDENDNENDNENKEKADIKDDIKTKNEYFLPYRLIMNNFTLLKLITYACSISNNTNDNTNVSELLGGDECDFTGLFCNLQI